MNTKMALSGALRTCGGRAAWGAVISGCRFATLASCEQAWAACESQHVSQLGTGRELGAARLVQCGVQPGSLDGRQHCATPTVSNVRVCSVHTWRAPCTSMSSTQQRPLSATSCTACAGAKVGKGGRGWAHVGEPATTCHCAQQCLAATLRAEGHGSIKHLLAENCAAVDQPHRPGCWCRRCSCGRAHTPGTCPPQCQPPSSRGW